MQENQLFYYYCDGFLSDKMDGIYFLDESFLNKKRPWQRPTLPSSFPLSTIGPAELNFRVRKENGCDLCGIVTKIFSYTFFNVWRYTKKTMQEVYLNN